jgi:hypothetical protein
MTDQVLIKKTEEHILSMYKALGSPNMEWERGESLRKQ